MGPRVAVQLAFAAMIAAASAKTTADQGMVRRAPQTSAIVDYNRDVRPILSAKCFACHGQDPKALQGGLRLDVRETALKVLSSGHAAIVPNKPDKSELINRITSKNLALLMPPASTNKTLSIVEKQILRTWISQGAEHKAHWAFVKPSRPVVPLPHNKNVPSIIHNPIDNFVIERLETEGLRPSPPSDKTTLIRRASLDLTGLPPSPAEVGAFLSDKSPKAFEKVVDRLLASPRYGERMAQSWMDGARYADSNGYQADYERFQWRWRDWVIDAFNKNMPFDQFTIEQIAGDMLPNATIEQKIATGFNRNHRINTEGGIIAEEWRVEANIDRVETTSAVWLGLTMGCARCHEHKYDPISQAEFYKFYAFFNNVNESGIGPEAATNTPPLLLAPTAEAQAKIASFAERIKDLTAKKQAIAQSNPPKTDPELLRVSGELDQANREKQSLETQSTVMVMDELPKPRECRILIRGQYDKPGEVVTAGLPESFGQLPTGSTNNRLGLAMWIANTNNPLTARVAVNRMWEKFFGIGLVATSEDFGTRAEFPSHPKLLDWLATEFVRLKWDMKALQKTIVMSATYQQSSKTRPELVQRDPDNRLLSHGPRFRLPGEVIRDQALAICGLLVEKQGGPSVRPYEPEGFWDEINVYGNLRNYKPDKGDGLYRRSLYTFWKRTSGPPNMGLFDVPGREMCRVRRSRTNTPLQALSLMNEITYVEASRVFAQRMIKEGGATPAERVSWAFRQAISRRPTLVESKVLCQGIEQRISKYRSNPEGATKLVSIGDAPRDPQVDTAELAAYTLTASILLNMDETVTKE